jgi:hypothetical protein
LPIDPILAEANREPINKVGNIPFGQPIMPAERTRRRWR